MKPNHLAEKGKVRLLLLKPGYHQRVTLVGYCYKAPSKRSMSKQEIDVSKREKYLHNKLVNILNYYTIC